MGVHTPARHQGEASGPGRKSIKQLNERLRREQREVARELQDRVARQNIPAREDGAPPRID